MFEGILTRHMMIRGIDVFTFEFLAVAVRFDESGVTVVGVGHTIKGGMIARPEKPRPPEKHKLTYGGTLAQCCIGNPGCKSPDGKKRVGTCVVCGGKVCTSYGCSRRWDNRRRCVTCCRS